MPYKTPPARIRNLIPAEHGQRLWTNVVNSQLKSGKSESVAMASAWAALKEDGYVKTDGKWVKKASGAKPLYMKRKVLNAERIVEWAKSHGVATTLDPNDMHVTVVYSKEPFNEEFTRAAEAYGEAPMYYGQHVVRGGKRSVERLGANGEALVLKIECPRLASEHYAFRAMGASSDWPDYKPHITISWNAGGLDEKSIRPFDGDIVLSDIFVSLLDEDWKSKVTEKKYASGGSVRGGAYGLFGDSVALCHPHFMGKLSTSHVNTTKEETYRAPAGARAAAARAIRWKEKYGDQVNGGTQVGWTRASQLANNEPLSRETVARMASFFARHEGNQAVDPKYKEEPWRDAGFTSFLLWGGDAGKEWSQRIMANMEKRQIDDHTFSDPASAIMQSMAMNLDGRIHVTLEDGQQGFYRPGEDEAEYKQALERIAGIEQKPSQAESHLIERVIAAIISATMDHETVNKRASAEILKVDDERRLIWAWAYVCTEDGKLLTDTQGDSIEPDDMEKMATDFMLDARVAKAMHDGDGIGEFVHSMPLTNEIMSAFGIHSDREGWITCLKVNSDEAWNDYKSGKFTGLSIGGRADRENLE